MRNLYKITYLVNGSQRTVAVDACDAGEAQERFIDHLEAIGAVHGTILSIRIAGAA